MEISLSSVIAVGALLIALIALALKTLDKGLSLREHNEFKEALKEQLQLITKRQEDRLVIREFQEWRMQINRDFDRLEVDLRMINQTKPTTGELEAAASAIRARVAVLEERVKEACAK